MPLVVPGRSTSLSLILGVFIGISISISSSSLAFYLRRKREDNRDRENQEGRVPRPIQLRSNEVLRDGVVGLIGECAIAFKLQPLSSNMCRKHAIDSN
jgi:cysteine synthase